MENLFSRFIRLKSLQRLSWSVFTPPLIVPQIRTIAIQGATIPIAGVFIVLAIAYLLVFRSITHDTIMYRAIIIP